MTTKREERERHRRERAEAEKKAAAAAKRRTLVGYVVAGLLGVAVLAGLVVVIAGGSSGSGGSDGGENARVDETFGILTDGLEVDDREAVAPPPSRDTSDLEQAADAANCDLTDPKEEGNAHVQGETTYESNPPTSGNHSQDPLARGAFTSEPPPENYVHTLEHGRIEIAYAPDLPEAGQQSLLGLYDESSAGMLLFPREDMPFQVAATAWGQLLGCDELTDETFDAIRAFRDTYRGNGPEQVPLR